MNEEKSRILKMLEDKKITADEAMKLLDALDKTESRPTERELRRKWLHVRVERDGKQTANIKIPLALLKFGFKFAPQKGRHGHGRAEMMAERARARAERARARAEKIQDRVERKLRDKFGDEAEVNLKGIFDEAFADADFGMPNMASISGGSLDDLFDGDFDLDLDRILEMAQDPSFDGNVLDVYNDDDDERVRITLE